MSSILTNNSAMVALQTMKSISMQLAKTTADISTGKNVASAKDNSAVWAISKTMESDVQGFKGISDSLALGSSTIAVARTAAETVTKLLTDIKGKIVSAQEQNMDKTKIQTDIAALRAQITSVVGAAQFNGLNLVNATGNVDILSSLDRSTTGVTSSSIAVTKQDLSTGAYTAKDVLTGSEGVSTNADTAGFFLDAGDTTAKNIVIDDSTTNFVAGDAVSITIGGRTATYTLSADDIGTTANPVTSRSDLVAIGLKKAIESLNISGLEIDYDSASPGTLAFLNTSTTADLSVTAQFKAAGSGGLAALAGIDVTTDAAGALNSIEGLLVTSINAASEFGSVGSRVDIQKEFVGKLTDAMKAGIGSLVDADMEEASARLQALQVQQQLSTQALSIANQQPQSLLSLFR